jgi:hypothetical protein
MKQKFSLIRDAEKDELIIKEYAELDKEILSLLCQESYSDEMIKAAINQGLQSVVAAIRTHNMYPPKIYTERIAVTIGEMYLDDGKPTVELFFDDRELFSENVQDGLLASQDDDQDSDDNNVEVDELLEDELEDDYDEDTNIVKKLKSSLKVSDDDESDLENP